MDTRQLIARIDNIALAKGTSRNKLLQACGTKSYVDNLQKGRIPNAETAMKVAEYCDISLDYLLGRTDDPTPLGGSKTEQKPVGIDGELISLLRDLSVEDKEELLRNARRMHELSVLREAMGNKYNKGE